MIEESILEVCLWENIPILQKLSACGTQTTALISSQNLLEMQVPRLHARPAESETLKAGPSKLCFNKPSRDSDNHVDLDCLCTISKLT